MIHPHIDYATPEGLEYLRRCVRLGTWLYLETMRRRFERDGNTNALAIVKDEQDTRIAERSE